MTSEEIAALRQERESDSKRENDYRNPFERDYARIIHAPSFRRLQGKSQVFGAGSGDYYRTRLTHSLEVGQIARFLAVQLAASGHSLAKVDQPWKVIDPLVVETAALAHDLGHPPFGHTGEHVLDLLLGNSGTRFEGNAQTFHILMFLEKRLEVYESNGMKTADAVDGLNLTAAVLLATNKYPSLLRHENDPLDQPSVSDKKGLYQSEWDYMKGLRAAWGLREGQRTLEAQLMDLADDIAYSAHDLEDGMRAGKFDPDILASGHRDYDTLRALIVKDIVDKPDHVSWPAGVHLERLVDEVLRDYYENWTELLRSAGGDISRARREIKGIWVGRFAQAVGFYKDETGTECVGLVKNQEENTQLRQAMVVLKKLAWNLMVQDFRVQRHQRRSHFIVEKLWEALSNPSIGRHVLPPDWISRYDHLAQRPNAKRGEWSWARLAADYIAGCTDAYAETLFGELYGGMRYGSIYERD